MNSFRSVERAIDFEIDRQTRVLDAGEALVQETRGWDDNRGETYTMRLKEESEDYRYFPEPDLPPLRTDAALLESIRARMPELPPARRARYRDSFGLSAYDASVIAASGGSYFDAAMASASRPDPKRTASLYSKVASARAQDAARLARSARPGPACPGLRAGCVGSHIELECRTGLRAPLRTGEEVDAIVAELGLTPDQRFSRAGRGHRASRGGKPGCGRGLPSGQAAGRQIPDRPGDEGDPRPGQPGRPAGPARGATPTRT